MDDVYYRKSVINNGVALLCVAVSSWSSLIPDATLAFVVSSISIHVAGLAVMFAPAWLWYGRARENGAPALSQVAATIRTRAISLQAE